MDLSEDPIEVPVDDLRIYRGYSGWSPGQLDNEIGAEAWAVVDAFADDLFVGNASTLWRRVLARQPEPLRWLMRMPSDISLN